MAAPSPVRLRCISPMGDRDLTHIPEVGRIVAVSEVIEVPAAVAGAKAGTYRAPTAAELASPTGFAGLRTRGGDTGPDGQERPPRSATPAAACSPNSSTGSGSTPRPLGLPAPEASETTPRRGAARTAERSPWPTAPVTTAQPSTAHSERKRTWRHRQTARSAGRRRTPTARSPRPPDRRSSSPNRSGGPKPQRRQGHAGRLDRRPRLADRGHLGVRRR